MREVFFAVTLSVYLLVTGWQTVSLGRYFGNIIKIFSGKTLADKKLILFGDSYLYAVKCREALPGRHSGRFITDMDMTMDPGMFNHRKLAYFLYPIDIRGIRSDQIDCLVIFKKKDAISYVGDDYQIVRAFDKENLLAMKKKSIKE